MPRRRRWRPQAANWQCAVLQGVWQERTSRRDCSRRASPEPALQRAGAVQHVPEAHNSPIRRPPCKRRRCSSPARPASGPARPHSPLPGQAGPWRAGSQPPRARQQVSGPTVWLAKPPRPPLHVPPLPPAPLPPPAQCITCSVPITPHNTCTPLCRGRARSAGQPAPQSVGGGAVGPCHRGADRRAVAADQQGGASAFFVLFFWLICSPSSSP